MLESTSSARIVMTTVASPEEAARLGRTLVEERLAACATLIPAVQSIYRWQGQIESSPKPCSCSKPPPIACLLSKPAFTNCTAIKRRSSGTCDRIRQPPYLAWLEASLRATSNGLNPALQRWSCVTHALIFFGKSSHALVNDCPSRFARGAAYCGCGVARHIWLQRGHSRRVPSVGSRTSRGVRSETELLTASFRSSRAMHAMKIVRGSAAVPQSHVAATKNRRSFSCRKDFPIVSSQQPEVASQDFEPSRTNGNLHRP